MDLKHNGANSNLYCDGRLYFVMGCPACDVSYEATMKPRWERARALADELRETGVTDLKYHADLWKVNAEGVFRNRKVRVEEI